MAHFIIEDLEKAASLMQEQEPVSGRLCKATAYALISHVALFEATWEKYHAGTCFVPGNSKWLGAKSWPEFKFAAGSAEAEYNFFFDKTIEYSAKVADSRERRCELMARQIINTIVNNIWLKQRKGALQLQCTLFFCL